MDRKVSLEPYFSDIAFPPAASTREWRMNSQLPRWEGCDVIVPWMVSNHPSHLPSGISRKVVPGEASRGINSQGLAFVA